MKAVANMARIPRVRFSAIFLSLAVTGTVASAAPPAATTPEFERDILPILKSRCVSCHNDEKHHGHLSLHDRAAIERGGESGLKIVNVPFEENEIWRRIADEDVEVRMPAEGPPLDAEDVATIQRWARAGAPWPARRTLTAPPPPDDSSWFQRLGAFIPTWFDPFLEQVAIVRANYGSVIYLTMAWLAFVVLTQRWKASDAPSRLVSLARRHATPACYGFLAAAIAAWGVWLHVARLHAREAQLAARIAVLEMEAKKFTTPPASFVELLEPLRPKHPPRLGGTYYRGNDERSPRLFNGGFYRTATMHLALSDVEDRRLAWGDTLPSDELFIRLEIERAPMATPTLFTPTLMAKAFLSPCRPATRTPGLEAMVYPLETLETGERWVGRVPVKLPSPDAAGDMLLSGELFLYHGVPGKEQISARPHFGMSYRINVKRGVIQPGSDLWMGSLYKLSKVFYPPPDRILPNEWFDSWEIPVIEGSNSTDPKLLGVEEHRDKLK